MLFKNRAEGGRVLATRLSAYADREDVIVLALPRGGVPVGFEVARALRAPLDVFVVRKLGVPGYEELAMGAIATGDVCVLNRDMIEVLGLFDAVIDATTARERRELDRRERRYRGERPTPDVRDRTVLLIDDGLATGSTMRAAVEALRRLAPARIVVGVPVGDPTTCDEMAAEADEIVCARTPRPFRAVGLWYQDFSQTTDEEVRELLDRAAASWNDGDRRPGLPDI
jgi:putative phosphoribosyl transferase